MFRSREVSVEEIRKAEPGDSFKYVRHTGGFAFGTMYDTHRYMIPEGCEALSAGSFYRATGEFRLFHEESLSLRIGPDKEDPDRLSEVLGTPCVLKEGDYI